jgi:hypothetical protein
VSFFQLTCGRLFVFDLRFFAFSHFRVRVAQDEPGSSQFLFANLTSRFSREGRSGRARQFSAFQFFNFSIFQFFFCDLRVVHFALRFALFRIFM